MLYEYTIAERREMHVLVQADHAVQAQRYFDAWYKEHGKLPIEGGDGLVDEILENNFTGRTMERAFKPESVKELVINRADVILPEEADEPQEPLFNLSFRFADGGDPIIFREQTLSEVGNHMAMFGKGYYLFPDKQRVGVFSTGYEDSDSKENWFDVYAVPKNERSEH